MMWTRNEHRNTQWFVKPTMKSKQQNKIRSKSPVQKFKYHLPSSFFKAVDEARLEAGYDILPHFHTLSISRSVHHKPTLSSSTHKSNQHHHRQRHGEVHFPSSFDNDRTSSNKHRSRHRHHKKVDHSSSGSSSVRKIKFNSLHIAR